MNPTQTAQKLEEAKEVVVEADIGLHKFTWRNHTLPASVPPTAVEKYVVLFAPNKNSEHILTTDLTAKLLADIDDFVGDDSNGFLAAHCILFKRSYLLHGPPGSGKSSLIQALASHYGRNVDAAFNKVRENMVVQSKITFSGLLNALDGIGRAAGHIVILTTNFLLELDSALVRKGRVDIYVELTDTTFDQIADMFHAFYPRETAERAAAFSPALTEALGPDRKLSMAGLQHYFVTHRRSSADEVITNFGEVAESIDDRKRDEEADRKEQN